VQLWLGVQVEKTPGCRLWKLLLSSLKNTICFFSCQVEKHIRKNKLKLTFTDQLGKAVTVSQDEESEVSSKKEAKKLAFYLFWNMRATLSRSPLFFFLAMQAWCRPSDCPSACSLPCMLGPGLVTVPLLLPCLAGSVQATVIKADKAVV